MFPLLRIREQTVSKHFPMQCWVCSIRKWRNIDTANIITSYKCKLILGKHFPTLFTFPTLLFTVFPICQPKFGLYSWHRAQVVVNSKSIICCCYLAIFHSVLCGGTVCNLSEYQIYNLVITRKYLVPNSRECILTEFLSSWCD